MTTQPSPAPLSGYQRSARSLGAKSALPLAAGTAMLLSASPAHAQAVATRVTTGNVVNSSNPNLYIDFETLSVSPTVTPQSDVRIYFGYTTGYDHIRSGIGGGRGGNQGPTTISGNGQYAIKLAASTAVQGANFGGSYSYLNGGYINGPYNGWASASSGFIGVRFSGSGGPHWAWLQLSTNADASQITLLAFGYNQTRNLGILTGEGLAPVPEPASSAALLALGAAGLVAYRKRKNLQRAAA